MHSAFRSAYNSTKAEFGCFGQLKRSGGAIEVLELLIEDIATKIDIS